jgi:AcrR family transcriptional regulator
VAERRADLRPVAWLLDAAVAEFGAYGYHGASMARVAQRAGTAHGTVYLHFADKDDLLQAAFTDVLAELDPAVLAVPVLRPGPEGLDELTVWLSGVCRSFQEHGAVLQAVNEAMSSSDRTAAGADGLRHLGRAVAAIGDRVRESGPGDLDPQIAALCIYALIEGSNRALFRGQLLLSQEGLAVSLAEFVQRALFGVGS